jgi:uncharacterized membrane protein
MLVPIPVVHAGIGLLMVLLSIPLVLRRVPMNRAYGVRVPKAFVSDENWYALNAYGGKLFLAFGLALLAFAALGAELAPPPTSLWAPVYLVAPLLGLVPVALRVRAFARRLPDR